MTSKSMLEKTGIEKSCRIKSENVIREECNNESILSWTFSCEN